MVKKKTTNKKVVKKTVKKKVVHKKHIEEIIPQVLDEKDAKEKMNEKKVSKKQKKNPLLQKNVLAIVAIFIVLVIIFIGVISIVISPCGFFKFSSNINGLYYCSNQYTPSVFFEEFKNLDEIYVSPALVEGEFESLEVNALLLWQVTLNSEQKNSIQLIRAVDEYNNLIYCSTNDGNIFNEKRLSKEECQLILNNQNKFFVLMEKGPEKVILEKNKIIIYSSNYKVVSQINFEVIKQIFSDAEKYRLIVNESIAGLN